MNVKSILKDCSVWMPSRDYEITTPTVSVLLPTSRMAKPSMFETAVQSVLNQDLKDLELIIIDDASTNEIANLIQLFMKVDSRVSCIQHQFDVGLRAISEYEGYIRARGDYIAFVFDDCEWEREFLSKTISFMARNQAKASYGRGHVYFGTEAVEYIEYGSSKNGLGTHTVAVYNHILSSGVVLSKEVLETVGLYDPHITMETVGAWSLWKRIIKKYEFFATDIFVGKVKKDAQPDICGESTWIMAEREAQSCDEMFLPNNFEEVDVNLVSENSSDFYCDVVNTHYKTFEGKSWYKGEHMLNGGEKPLRLLILASSYDATMNLSFLRLTGKTQRFVFKYGTQETSLEEILHADAIIIVRNVFALDGIKRACQLLKIPCYLYLDDNFAELSKDNKKSIELQRLSALLNHDQLNLFDGILTSTDELKDYFDELCIATTVHTLPPCMGDELKVPVDIENPSPYVMAYMGGIFRDNMLTSTVIPALVKLSSKYRLKLLLPSRINVDRYRNIRNLEFVPIENSLSLDEACMRYGKHCPQFLLHCGPEIRNNQYKTENALINATQMGSLLVASNVFPFRKIHNSTCVCADNTVSAWYQTLESLILNPDTRKRIQDAARLHCRENYSPQRVVSALEAAFFEKTCESYCALMQRCGRAIYDLLHIHSINTQSSAVIEIKESKPLGQLPLVYTGEIIGTRRYKICCKSESFSQLGICFASYGDPRGIVRVTISSAGTSLRECVLEMEDFVRNNWTYLEFEPIEHPKNKIFEITLDFNYEDVSVGMGLFEDAHKRSLFYRILSKLGFRINIKDLLFSHCR